MIETMKQMVEALEIAAEGGGVDFYAYAKEGRQAIAEAEKQESVGKAYLCDKCYTPFDGAYMCPSCGHNQATKEAVYAHPQPRKPLFVGLTDEEILTYRHMIDWTAQWSYINFARAIEAAHGIKEKNNTP